MSGGHLFHWTCEMLENVLMEDREMWARAMLKLMLIQKRVLRL
jgi:hypothetical protein